MQKNVQPISQTQISAYRNTLNNQGIDAVSDIYKDIKNKGYSYAGWADGVATGNTITGQSALGFMGNTAAQNGIFLDSQTINKIRVEMLHGYLNALQKQIDENGGFYTSQDVNYKETREFHKKVFEANNLSINNWTLETPMALYGKYFGENAQEKQWQELRQTEGDYADALFGSLGLQEMTRDFAMGLVFVDKETGEYIHSLPASGSLDDKQDILEGKSSIDEVDRVPVSEDDKKQAEKWLNDAEVMKGIWESMKHWFQNPKDILSEIFDDIYNWLPDSFKIWLDLNRNGTHTFYDPLILDLDGNGISTVAIDNKYFNKNTFFDFDGDGIAHATGWTTTDGILVRDINNDGIINNGTEVFGDYTIKQDGTRAKHGFDALADLDENKDGKIDNQDSLFAQLKVWQDKNKDGISQKEELQNLTDLNIQSLNLDYKNSNQQSQGGKISQLSNYTKNDGITYQMGDVDFNFSHVFSQQKESLDTKDVKHLLNLAGRGKVRSLQEAKNTRNQLY